MEFGECIVNVTSFSLDIIDLYRELNGGQAFNVFNYLRAQNGADVTTVPLDIYLATIYIYIYIFRKHTHTHETFIIRYHHKK